MTKQSTKSAKRILVTSAQETVKILVMPNPIKGNNPEAMTYAYQVDTHDPVGMQELVGYAVDNGYVPNTNIDIALSNFKGIIGAAIRLVSNGRPITFEGLLNIRLVAKGGTNDPNQPFREGHNTSLYYNAVISRALNRAANNLSTHVEGLAPDRSLITSVVNPINKSRLEFFQGGSIVLRGHNIKIFPENDTDCKLIYVSNDTGIRYPYTGFHASNTSSRVISSLPADIPTGSYRIELHTKYIKGKQVCKKAKVVHYNEDIEVIYPSSPTV